MNRKPSYEVIKMDNQHVEKKWINVDCEDIDGSSGYIPIARFEASEAQKAIDLALSIYEYNGSVRITFEEF